MHQKFNPSEKGQAIVYLVLGLVVFLGFVALAIDGGMALADRRHAQNGADAASLAGGGNAAAYLEDHNDPNLNWSCSDNRVTSSEGIAQHTAKDRAENNGFIIDYNTSDHNGVVTKCTSIPYGDYTQIYLDVTVDISDTTPSNFLQLISPTALHNEVEADTRIYPSDPLGFGNAIVALDPNACGGNNGAIFSGTGDSKVTGGGVFTNGCLYGNGRPSVDVETPYGFNVVGEWIPGNTDWTPDHATNVPNKLPQNAYYIAPPTCTTWYTEPQIKALAPNLPSGLYCFKNKVNLGNYDLTGTDITFYTESDLIFNGNNHYDLSAPTTGALAEVFIYAKNNSGTCTSQTIQLNGNSDTVFSGIIYAPCGEVTMSGTGDITSKITFNSQIIGWNVKVTGTAQVEINYLRDKAMLFPTKIELYR